MLISQVLILEIALITLHLPLFLYKIMNIIDICLKIDFFFQIKSCASILLTECPTTNGTGTPPHVNKVVKIQHTFKMYLMISDT